MVVVAGKAKRESAFCFWNFTKYTTDDRRKPNKHTKLRFDPALPLKNIKFLTVYFPTIYFEIYCSFGRIF